MNRYDLASQAASAEPMENARIDDDPGVAMLVRSLSCE
jgi:hypothetical protein